MYKKFLPLLLMCLALPILSAQEPRVIYDGSSPVLWETVQGYEWNREHCAYNRIGYDREAGAVTWEFRRKAGPEKQNLTISYTPISFEPSDRYVLEMRNLGDAPARLEFDLLHYGEKAPCYNYSECWKCPRNGIVPNDGEWHRVEFVWKGDWLGSPEVVMPITRLDIYALLVPLDTPMHLQFRRIEVMDERPPQGTLATPLALPSQLTAGEEFDCPELAVDFASEGRMPIDPRVWLEFTPVDSAAIAGEQFPVRCELTGRETQERRWLIPAQKVLLPKYIYSGNYQATLHCGECVVGEPFAVAIAGVDGIPRLTLAQVLPFQGAPTIHLDGKPVPGVMKATFTHGPKSIAAFAKANVDLFSFDATPTENTTVLHCLACETAPGVFHYEEFDERVMMVLRQHPNAYIMPRLFLSAPLWWLLDHPEACVTEEDAQGNHSRFDYQRSRPVPCWASEAWREYTCDRIRRLIEHIRKAPYASRVIGFELSSGTTQEWMGWGSNENAWTGFCPANRDGFRKWLTRKYQSDKALQAAWKDGTVTLATVELPTRAEREARPKDSPDLRQMDVSADLKCVDYDSYFAEMTAETIAVLCHAVTEGSDGRMLAGAFYGYVFELCGSQRLLNSGHCATTDLLDNPDVDFLCAPISYCYRQVGGEGTPMQMNATGSLKLHDKLWFVEVDMRTSETDCPPGYAGKAPDLAGDFLQQEKQAAFTLCNGLAQWWFDVGYISYENPTLMARIGELAQTIKELTMTCDRTSAAQIAVVVDDKSLPWARVPSDWPLENITYLVPELERLGASVQYYYASDLDKLPESTRVILLTTSLAPSPAQAAALKRWQADGRVIFFFHAPGMIPFREDLTPEESMREFTGMPIALADEVKPAPVKVTNPGGDWLPEAILGTELRKTYWGTRGRPIKPAPVVVPDAQTTVLAQFVSGEPAIAVKEFGDWTGVHLATAYVPRELFLAGMRKAGVHRYIETADQVWATRDLLGICVKEAGERAIRLPSPATMLHDAYTGEDFTPDADGVFHVDFAPLSTRLFVIQK
ncbi:MAG: beta-galactosidase [Victivallales bacterium]|nr:beta-galactosidase [Victivallales bacterium]